MNKVINNQAQNEVKEMLSEYVVSPISNNVVQKFEVVKNEVDKIEEISSKVSSITNQISGQSYWIKNIIKEKFDSIGDNIRDNSNDIYQIKKSQDTSKNNINSIISELDKIFDQLSTVITTLESLKRQEQDNYTNSISKLKNNNDLFIKEISDTKDKICSLQTHTDNINQKLHSAISDNYSALVKNLDERTNKSSELFEDKVKMFSDMFNFQDNLIKSSLSGVQTELNNSILNGNTQIVDSLDDRIQNIERKNSLNFKVMLTFGTANIITLIALIVILLVK